MSVILVGYRGSGKTSIARCIAAKKSWKMIDTDQEIVRVAGKSIRDIFEQDGEAAFRDLEAQQVGAVCTVPHAAISLGGGAVLRDGNRAVICAGGTRCVYLRCDVKELDRRIRADAATSANRPPLTHLGGSRDEIAALLAQREPLYRAAATHELDVTSLTVEAACETILGWL